MINSPENKNNIQVMKNTSIIIKIIAAIFLIFALFTFPIDFYKIVRIVVMAASIYCAYNEYKKNGVITPMMWVFGIIVIVFNPILPFYLGKTLWKFTDAITFLIFSLSLYLEIKEKFRS